MSINAASIAKFPSTLPLALSPPHFPSPLLAPKPEQRWRPPSKRACPGTDWLLQGGSPNAVNLPYCDLLWVYVPSSREILEHLSRMCVCVCVSWQQITRHLLLSASDTEMSLLWIRFIYKMINQCLPYAPNVSASCIVCQSSQDDVTNKALV